MILLNNNDDENNTHAYQQLQTTPFPSMTVITQSLLILFSFLALWFSINSQVKVHKTFGVKEPSLVLSTLYINLALITLVLGCAMNIT